MSFQPIPQLHINAMILAAGLGTRLGSLGQALPKVLIDVGGRPLLERQLDYLGAHGVRRIVINLHHLAKRVEAFIRSYHGPIEIVPVFEDELLGTAGAVRHALRHLQPGPFLVLYGEVLVEEPLDSMIDFHGSARGVATLAVHEAEYAEGKGIVEVADTGRVTGYREKGSRARGRFLINSGIYIIKHKLVASLPAGQFRDFGKDVFPGALARGQPIFAHRLSTPVIDIGTPAGLALARAAVASGARDREARAPTR